MVQSRHSGRELPPESRLGIEREREGLVRSREWEVTTSEVTSWPFNGEPTEYKPESRHRTYIRSHPSACFLFLNTFFFFLTNSEWFDQEIYERNKNQNPKQKPSSLE